MDNMIIAADKNQFAGSHGKSNARKHKQMEQLGCQVKPIPLPFGDYCLVTEQMQETIDRRGEKLKKQDLIADIKLSIDTKKNLEEVVGNICGKSHGRFRDEAIMAMKMGAKFIVLVEDETITDVRQVFQWNNPRTHRYNKIKYMHSLGKWLNIPLPKSPPTSGQTLAKAMLTMQSKYNIDWRFCKPSDAGATVVEMLKGEQ